MKPILTKLLAMFMAAVMISGYVPLNAAVTITDGKYSTAGKLLGGTVTQIGTPAINADTKKAAYANATVGVFVCDALGRKVGGVDENNNPYSFVYDSFGNLSSQTSIGADGKPTTTQYCWVTNAQGQTLGRVGLTFNRDSAYSQADFIAGIQKLMTAIADPNVKPQALDSTSGGFNIYDAFKDITSISCSGKVLMAMFGTYENFAKIMQFGDRNEWEEAQAQKRAQDAANKSAEAKADAAQAAAQAAANQNAETTHYTQTASGSATETATETSSYNRIVQTALNFAAQIWGAITDLNASIRIDFGSTGQDGKKATVIGATVQIPQGKTFEFAPDVESCTVSATAKVTKTATAVGTDPVVTGQYLGTTEIDGQTYLMVDASSINLFQNEDFESGFIGTSGNEVVYIAMSAEQAAQIAAQAAENGNSITITGNAMISADGQHLTMEVNAGGWALGKDAEESKANWLGNTQKTSGGQAFYTHMYEGMKAVWQGTNFGNDYVAAWNYLVGDRAGDEARIAASF